MTPVIRLVPLSDHVIDVQEKRVLDDIVLNERAPKSEGYQDLRDYLQAQLAVIAEVRRLKVENEKLKEMLLPPSPF